MASDFFEYTSPKLPQLNDTEKKMYDFTVRNMDRVKMMSIRTFAQEVYFSTATVFRFVKKLGFSGYNQFIAMLQLTDPGAPAAVIPAAMKGKGYREEYLKNVIEALRVMKKESVRQVHAALIKRPKIYLFATGLTVEAARYIRHLFIIFGFDAELAYEVYHMRAAVERITSEDLVFVLSYTGENKNIIEIIERIRRGNHPTIVSITRADNNMTQIMSDINFYFFADDLKYNGVDITSRLGLIAIVEMLLYNAFSQGDDNLFTKK